MTTQELALTRDLAGYVAALQFRDLPPEVVDRVGYFAFDYVGVAARGSLEESTKTMYRFLKDICPTSKGGSVIGTRLRMPPEYAALANGTSSHSLEMDDVSNEASLHPGVAIFPTAFAASELTAAGGQRFTEGVVAGYEVMIRLGKAVGPREHYTQGFHPTGTCGTFGAAATAARILGLDAEQTLNALGIAGSQAAGSMEFLAQGAWTKRMHPGWAAHAGLIAALLARRGFVGPSTILEGSAGFLRAYSPKPDPAKAAEGLGGSFAITRTSIKPHSCCRYMQPPIDGVLEIMRRNSLEASDVEQVTLGILKAGMPIVAEPAALKCDPKSVVDAQFSMPFGAAVAMLYGEATLDQFRQKVVDDPAVAQMMRRVRCVHDPSLDTVYPKQWPASVELETRDGRKFATRVEFPKGDPENALSWEALAEKFGKLTTKVYSKTRARRICADLRNVSRTRDIRRWAALLLKDR